MGQDYREGGYGPHYIVGVCYRPTVQEDEADEVHYRQLEAASCSQVWVVLRGDFNHPDTCHTAGCGQSGRFLGLLTTFLSM